MEVLVILGLIIVGVVIFFAWVDDKLGGREERTRRALGEDYNDPYDTKPNRSFDDYSADDGYDDSDDWKEDAIIDNRLIGFDEACVLDVETTGLDPQKDRIVEVAAIRVDFRKSGEDQVRCPTFVSRFNPGVPIPKRASDVNGITNEAVADAGRFADEAQALRDFIGSVPVIGHNISFDKKFLSSEFKRAGVKTLHRNKSYCTMWRFRNQFPGRKSNLDSVCAHFGRGRDGTVPRRFGGC